MVGTRWNPASEKSLLLSRFRLALKASSHVILEASEDHGRSGNHIIFHNIWYRTQTEDDCLPISTCILIDVPILYYIDIWSKREYMYVDIICNMSKHYNSV